MKRPLATRFAVSTIQTILKRVLRTAKSRTLTRRQKMAGTFDFTMFNGEDFDRTLTWSSSSTPVSKGGTPVDLTNYTSSLTLNETDNFITTTASSNGQISLGGDLGTVRLYIPALVAATFVNTSVTYRLFVTNSSNETSCVLAGNFRVKP
jgi:hypothetical protein